MPNFGNLLHYVLSYFLVRIASLWQLFLFRQLSSIVWFADASLCYISNIFVYIRYFHIYLYKLPLLAIITCLSTQLDCSLFDVSLCYIPYIIVCITYLHIYLYKYLYVYNMYIIIFEHMYIHLKKYLYKYWANIIFVNSARLFGSLT